MASVDPIADTTPAPPKVPSWAVPRGPVGSDTEAAFMAGAALNSLDNLVRQAPAWAGCWRQRLALKCAVAAAELSGRTENETAVRDAWHLRHPGTDPGPAGRLFGAWKRTAELSPTLSTDRLQKTVDHLGFRWNSSWASFSEHFEEVVRSNRPAPLVAAAVMNEVLRRQPNAGLIGWWAADLAIAARMRWPVAVPLLVAQAQGFAFRSPENRRRVRPGEPAFERSLYLACALAATDACHSAGEVSSRAVRLIGAQNKLRARGAAEVVRLLLDQDSVSGTLRTSALTRWGARRLFERLSGLEAVRELSGRASFRIYGL